MAITSTTAYQTQYRQEFIKGFEQHQSLLRETATTEVVIKGNTATFLVADSGGSIAVTRGNNGLIPARTDNVNQSSATLAQWHDLSRKEQFDIFAGQSNQRAIMQMTTMGVVNRKIDSDIITALNTGTVNTGTAVAGSVALFTKAQVKLGNASVPWDGNITLLCTPAFLGYLEQAPEFTSAQFVNLRPNAGDNASWRDTPTAYRWRNALIIPHPALPGIGTSNAQCFMYHKTAIGHAFNSEDLQSLVGYHEEQDYSWARCSVYMGSKLLQNSGVIVVNHDDSALS